MKANRQRQRRRLAEPQIVYDKGRPSAVLLDIRDYEELLERAEDTHDLAELERRRKESTVYRSIGEYLAEREAE